ncbi:VOC family protein [Roseibium sp. Sym1]|uniref:VOC family protein n=1 Tax=Roseibium sp. Sym1 TaxID=3016006 RepID=UPI0022B2DE71|nr:VOC family protein [Roseibium sp. Sym1]
MDLNQVTLEAVDFDASVDFYKTLGLHLIVLSEGRYARFERPSGSSTLSLHKAEQPVASGTVLYFEVEDVERRCRELVGKGVTFDTTPTEERWRWKEARFTDPSGNRLCLFHAGPDRRFPPWRLTGRTHKAV